jgi:multicomponent Na+:H+ antiporter subunit A
MIIILPLLLALGAALAGGATLWAWSAGGGAIDVPWAPTWGLRLSFALDGLIALVALMFLGGGLAFIYMFQIYRRDF